MVQDVDSDSGSGDNFGEFIDDIDEENKNDNESGMLGFKSPELKTLNESIKKMMLGSQRTI
jgi:hypothetical protein